MTVIWLVVYLLKDTPKSRGAIMTSTGLGIAGRVDPREIGGTARGVNLGDLMAARTGRH